MAKVTNRKLQEVKNDYYSIYTFGNDGSRCGSISGCNIIRSLEEAQNGLTLMYRDELDKALVPVELFSELGLKEGNRKMRPVWIWVLDFEASRKRRATWQEVDAIFTLAKAWLRNQAQEVAV